MHETRRHLSPFGPEGGFTSRGALFVLFFLNDDWFFWLSISQFRIHDSWFILYDPWFIIHIGDDLIWIWLQWEYLGLGARSKQTLGPRRTCGVVWCGQQTDTKGIMEKDGKGSRFIIYLLGRASCSVIIINLLFGWCSQSWARQVDTHADTHAHTHTRTHDHHHHHHHHTHFFSLSLLLQCCCYYYHHYYYYLLLFIIIIIITRHGTTSAAEVIRMTDWI